MILNIDLTGLDILLGEDFFCCMAKSTYMTVDLTLRQQIGPIIIDMYFVKGYFLG